MKLLKKLICVLLVLSVMGFSVACNGEQTDKTYVFVMPDGAPSLSAVSLMKNHQKINGINVEYRIVPADQIGPTFVSQGDIAIMPTNASAKLFNKGIDLKLLSVNVFGVLYMIGHNPIESLEDLKGEVVYNIGMGGTPDLLLKYFLQSAGIEYEESTEAIEGKVALAYENDATAVIGKMSKGIAKYGVMGQPVVTNANKKLGTQIVLDFQEQFKKLSGGESYPQAGVVIKGEVAKDSEFVSALFKALCENKDFITNNPQEIKGVLANFGSSLTFDFTADVVNACNIGCKQSISIRASLENYFNSIKAFDPTFIGGNLPGDNYYYSTIIA